MEESQTSLSLGAGRSHPHLRSTADQKVEEEGKSGKGPHGIHNALAFHSHGLPDIRHSYPGPGRAPSSWNQKVWHSQVARRTMVHPAAKALGSLGDSLFDVQKILKGNAEATYSLISPSILTRKRLNKSFSEMRHKHAASPDMYAYSQSTSPNLHMQYQANPYVQCLQARGHRS